MSDILKYTTGVQQTVGQILKAAREAKQISIGEVSQNLLISKKIITAIEEDDYSKIPAQVYAEGYLKAYAQFLQIPVHTIIANFRRLNVYATAELKHRTEPRRQQYSVKPDKLQNLLTLLRKQNLSFIAIGLLALLVLGMLIFYIGKQVAGKNTEVISVPSITNSLATESNKLVSEESAPMVAEVDSENYMVEPKNFNKIQHKKTQRHSNTLILEPNSPKSSSLVDEPRLILTKPKI